MPQICSGSCTAHTEVTHVRALVPLAGASVQVSAPPPRYRWTLSDSHEASLRFTVDTARRRIAVAALRPSSGADRRAGSAPTGDKGPIPALQARSYKRLVS